jgi:carbon starvation protein
MLVEGFLATLVIIAIAGFGGIALGDKLMTTGAIPRFVASFAAMVSIQIPFLKVSFMNLFAAVWVSTFALTTLDTTNRLGRYIMQEMAEPLKDKSPTVYGIFHNKWVASILIAFIGLFLARSGGYTVIWPAFSGANQLLASVAMLTVALWVNKKLKAKFVLATVLPALLLWVTVVAALVWYEIVIVPVFFVDMAKSMNIITGVVVGVMNLAMLVLSFVMLFSFRKRWAEEGKLAKA